MPQWISIAMVGVVMLGIGWALGRAIAGMKAASANAKAEEIGRQLVATVSERDSLRKEKEMAQQDLILATQERKQAQEKLEEQKKFLEEARVHLTDSFKALAAESLDNSHKTFLQLATDKFKSLSIEAQTDLEGRKKAIQDLLQPLNETMATYQRKTDEFAQKYSSQFGQMSEQLMNVAKTQSALQSETSRLVNALKHNQKRGEWGEITLRRVVELAGMMEYCDFDTQVTGETEDGQQRPDMVIHLPNQRDIIVDSKVPMTNFMEALEAETDEKKKELLSKHSLALKLHIDKLSGKGYWKAVENSLDFVILFVPNDSVLYAALENYKGNLMEEALSKNIILATPATFLALLKAVAYGWQQKKIAESAAKVYELGRELSDRVSTVVGHFNDLGKNLEDAVQAYNKAAGSMESRLFISARKFRELGGADWKNISELQPIQETARKLPDSKE